MDKAVELLVADWKAVASRMEERNQGLADDKKKKAKLEKAMKALGWTITSEGKAVEQEESPGKETLTQKHVRDVAVTAVKENPGIDRQALVTFVNSKLCDDMKLDMKGIGLRWDEVWSSGTFEISDSDIVSLASSQRS